MTTVKTSSSRLKSFGIVSVVAIGILAGCGERGSADPASASKADQGAKANTSAQCFYPAGGLSENDAALFSASEAGDLDRVGQAIDEGGNVNAADALKRTPLFAAAFCNRPDATNLLIDKGSDVSARDFLGMSPLHAAVVVGGDDSAKALISKGANINQQDATGHTPLHIAAATGQMSMVELLLNRGANVQLRDKDGVTASSMASTNGHKTVAATIKKWREKQKTPSQK